ncbi:MAG TPA: aminoglycoside phosphotransferase family protein [Chitinophagaceae bacterium]|nr:aminoglycoside phosphotransferase family protein [Chitinophagaceae bacterium]
MLEHVLEEYGFKKDCIVLPFGNGLINHTWKLTDGNNDYILQKINEQVFTKPEVIAKNINNISHYLSQQAPHYIFPTPVKNRSGKELLYLREQGYFRIFPFIKKSHSIDTVSTQKQANEAAKAFGHFTKLLASFNAAALGITLKDFHNLSLRYQQFETALKNGNKERIQQSQKLIQTLISSRSIVEDYKSICSNPDFKIRVTHHDTKISNVLFDEDDNSICIIDLDTVMPGYFISDVGDMIRTYLSPAGEEEKDLSIIEVREDFFQSVVCGYLSEMKYELTEREKQSFVYAGKFLIYMQALRFLTDYLNGDIYYRAAYEGHNLMRAQNQSVLLQRLCEKEKSLEAIVKKILEN